MSTQTLNLDKININKQKVIDLKKNIGLEGQKAQVVLALDYSVSMQSLYYGGKVQEVLERFLPLGLAFDDNGEIDFYLFHNSYRKLPEPITLRNVFGYVNNKIMGKYEFGGTQYAPVINAIVNDFGQQKKSGGFLGIGSKKEATKLEYPVLVLFPTDGECSDREDSERAIINASKSGIFFQFIGIGGASFNFLRKLDTMSGRNIDNANFFEIYDVASKSDEELYKLLLQEFPSFVREARSKNMIA